jgi:hypothetical protein
MTRIFQVATLAWLALGGAMPGGARAVRAEILGQSAALHYNV